MPVFRFMSSGSARTRLIAARWFALGLTAAVGIGCSTGTPPAPTSKPTGGVGGEGPSVTAPEPSAGREGGSRQNLAEIAKAMHTAVSASADGDSLPLAASQDKGGKPLLSWRVALLPHLKQDALYKQFKLDEPWDSEANKKLVEKMPAVYASPDLKAPPGQTHFKVFVGGGAMFEPPAAKPKLSKLSRVSNGFHRHILVAETGDPVPWTKPEDVTYDPAQPLPKLAVSGGGDSILVATVDATVGRLDLKKVSEKSIRGAITAMDPKNYAEDGWLEK